MTPSIDNTMLLEQAFFAEANCIRKTNAQSSQRPKISIFSKKLDEFENASRKITTIRQSTFCRLCDEICMTLGQWYSLLDSVRIQLPIEIESTKNFNGKVQIETMKCMASHAPGFVHDRVYNVYSVNDAMLKLLELPESFRSFVPGNLNFIDLTLSKAYPLSNFGNDSAFKERAFRDVTHFRQNNRYWFEQPNIFRHIDEWCDKQRDNKEYAAFRFYCRTLDRLADKFSEIHGLLGPIPHNRRAKLARPRMPYIFSRGGVKIELNPQVCFSDSVGVRFQYYDVRRINI